MAKRVNWRGLKRHRAYTIEEVARALRVHKNTVRNWGRDGLLILDEKKPHLVRGGDARDFLCDRQQARKQTLRPGEMLCLGCSKPRTPDPALVEDLSGPTGAGQLRAICPVCTTLMHRRIARGDIPGFLQAAERWNGRERH